MKCYLCDKDVKKEEFVLGWAVLCSQKCYDELYKESHDDLGCKTCEDKCETPKK